jgi:acyl-coenzyme A thioesterase PaaI-like protein
MRIMSGRVGAGSLQTALRARAQSSCFVCGQDNPHGLQIQFQRQDDGGITATWTPAAAWEGFRGIIHGGIVSAVLDEAMSKAVASTKTEALTAELRVRFRRRVTSGSPFSIRGWIVSRNKRLIKTEAVLLAPDGKEHARAWATFLPLTQVSKPADQS